ncbi:MAG: hypothetical protein ACRYGR_08125 [Janthinobacterium lividum]
MPYVKKGKKKPAGIGASYRAKKKAANYGATPAFNKALVAAVKKVEMKQTETVYSQASLFMGSFNSYTLSGYNMSALNQTGTFSASAPANRCNGTSQCLLFPVSIMAQVGNTSTPGYRKGQSICPVGLRVAIKHDQGLSSVGATFKWALIRDKGASLLASGVTISSPAIGQTTAINLFVPMTQGPLVSASALTGTPPTGDFVSAMRWNSYQWRKVKSGSWTMPATASRENTGIVTAPTSSSVTVSASKNMVVYCPIPDKTWDYPAPTAINNIKGGDYFFVIWREGAGDPALGYDQMSVFFELSFKDP